MSELEQHSAFQPKTDTQKIPEATLARLRRDIQKAIDGISTEISTLPAADTGVEKLTEEMRKKKALLPLFQELLLEDNLEEFLTEVREKFPDRCTAFLLQSEYSE